ncbi:MAG: hypothetical protein R3F48_13400 [Candidatus Zixiibacteriota bacterium]
MDAMKQNNDSNDKDPDSVFSSVKQGSEESSIAAQDNEPNDMEKNSTKQENDKVREHINRSLSLVMHNDEIREMAEVFIRVYNNRLNIAHKDTKNG